MSEGANGQFDSQQALQKDPKDLLANAWAEQLHKTEKTPEQIIGEFVSGGARIVNYVATAEMGWKPIIAGNHRKMVLLAGSVYAGSRWGAETLKKGLSFSVNIDGSNGFRTESLCMVPYPRFDQEGKVDMGGSLVFLFSKKQVQELKNLVGLTPPPQSV